MHATQRDNGDDLLIALPAGIDGNARQVVIRFESFHWQFARSGGPGGQNVNKVSTKAILRWNPYESSLPHAVIQRLFQRSGRFLTSEQDLLITSQRHRTRPMNMQDCVNKLRDLIEAAIPAPVFRKATKPTRGSKERRLRDKKLQSHRRKQRRIQQEE